MLELITARGRSAQMTLPKIDFAEYPPELRSGTADGSVTYELRRDRYALHHNEPDEPPFGNAEIVLREDDRLIEIFSADTAPAMTKASLGPVYSKVPSGGLAVPTGLVFVRFRSGVSAAGKKRNIELAGYGIARLIEYAPEAVWLKHRSDDIAAALTYIPALQNIRDIENVEPQMLMQRANK